MSNASRRAVSSRPSGGERPVATKADLVEFLGYEGWTLNTQSFQSGFGSTGLSYYAVKGDTELLLDNAYPGDRRDWQGMWDYFKGTALRDCRGW